MSASASGATVESRTCKAENDVPEEPFFFRTWIERYRIYENGETTVECISTRSGPPEQAAPEDPTVVRTFFVPKLCNQCAHPPCVQVCPVGATFQTQDGVVLVDEKRCIGCRYCIQACPYGARYLHPVTLTADKCTFCYHRVQKDLLPACVEVCPTQARVFGDLLSPASPLTRLPPDAQDLRAQARALQWQPDLEANNIAVTVWHIAALWMYSR